MKEDGKMSVEISPEDRDKIRRWIVGGTFLNQPFLQSRFFPSSNLGSNLENEENDSMFDFSETSSLNSIESNSERETETGPKKRKNSSIEPELREINLPEKVRQRAVEIYAHFKTNYRKDNRKRAIYFSCLQAYKELEIPVDHQQLARKLGSLKTKDISKSLSKCSELETGYSTVNKEFTFLDQLKIYYTYTNLESSGLNLLLELGESLLEKNPGLKQLPLITVAGAILIYFLENQGVKYDKKIFESIGRKQNVIETMIKNVIAPLDNSI